MELLLIPIALLFYLGSTVAFMIALATSSERAGALGPVLLAAGAAAHACAIAVHSVAVGSISVATAAESLSLLGWTLAVVYLLCHRSYDLTAVGAVAAPVALMLAFPALLVSAGDRSLPPILLSAWLPVHVALAFLGNAVLALASATSLFYLFEDRQLKAKKPPRIRSLFPSLEKLDRLNHNLLIWGFPLLTLGIVSGALWAQAAWGRFWTWEARETWSFLIWLLYAGLLHGRLFGRWRGRRAATLTVLGFAFVILSFVSLNFLFPGRHGGSYGS